MHVATDSEIPVIDRDDDILDIDDCAPESTADTTDGEPAPPSRRPISAPRQAMSFGLAVIVVLTGLVGWLGFGTYRSHQAQAQRSQFLQVARQGALNLTTIDWQNADTDVQRILDGATGEFYDEFSRRSQPFIEVLKKAQAKTVGTITGAGLESEEDGSAQALVSLAVRTSDASATDQVPRSWRMRISVQKVDDEMKVSNVEFVP